MFQLDLLKGKRILVTGGGTGLGRSMSRRFLELGANVVICGRREDVLKQTAEELTKATVRIDITTLLRSPASIQRRPAATVQ